MSQKKIIGNYGETVAIKYLEKKGYKIIARNLKLSYQEIDIVANNKDKIIFFEIKTRTNDIFGGGENAIDKKKIQNMKKAIMHYSALNKTPLDDCRFDVILVDIDKTKKIAKIKHYMNIF